MSSRDRGGNQSGGFWTNERNLVAAVLTVGLAVGVVPLLVDLVTSDGFGGPAKAAETAPFFGPRQQGRLVEQLATATAAQGVCYGWVIDSGRPRTISKVTPSYPGTFRPTPPGTPPPSPGVVVGAPDPTSTRRPSAERDVRVDLQVLDDPGVEYGSNLGPSVDPRQVPGRCAKWVVLESDYNYSTTSKQFTFGRLRIESSFDGLHSLTLESKLGQTGEDDIDGEDGVARLRDAIGALPMLVAEEGLAPPVQARTSAVSSPPAGDRLHEARLTQRNVWTGIGVALIACAVLGFAVAAVSNRRKNRA